MKIILSLFILLGMIAVAGQAWADIDHMCLNQCVASGNSNASCMPRCSFGGTSGTPVVPPAKSMPHGVFSSLTPTDGAVVVKPKPLGPLPGNKDYACFNTCLQQHNTYQLCEQQCQKTPCPAGSVSCSDLTGVVNGGAAQPLSLSPH